MKKYILILLTFVGVVTCSTSYKPRRKTIEETQEKDSNSLILHSADKEPIIHSGHAAHASHMSHASHFSAR
jgi:hypothetical protein